MMTWYVSWSEEIESPSFTLKTESNPDLWLIYAKLQQDEMSFDIIKRATSQTKHEEVQLTPLSSSHQTNFSKLHKLGEAQRVRLSPTTPRLALAPLLHHLDCEMSREHIHR